MTDDEILKVVDKIEAWYLESYAAKKYLKLNDGIADPTAFLATEIAKIPKTAGLRILFEPLRLAVGQGLHDSEFLEQLRKTVQELPQPPVD